MASRPEQLRRPGDESRRSRESLRAAVDRIGPIGVCARVAVGTTLIALAVFWNDATVGDALLGLVAMPAIVTVLTAAYARSSRPALRATGPVGHALNCAVFVPLFIFSATSEPAFLFYGTSMLVAAAHRAGGCEVTAISNVALERDDQVGCVPFAPIDLLEDRLRSRR
jgi:hypothetical protein